MADAETAPDLPVEFLQRSHRLLIGGAWVEPTSDREIAVENPATEEIIARVRSASLADLDAAVAAARTAFEGPWRRLAPADRARMLFRLADLVEANADELSMLEMLENGMPRSLSRMKIGSFCANLVRYYAGWVTKIHGATLPAVPAFSQGEDWLVMTLREPVGVAGAIIPWNAPSAMITLKLAPALAAGCTMVLKPAELTPLLAIRFAELVEEAGFPPGVFNLVQGYGDDIGRAMAAHPGIDKINFTGSTEVGREIVRAAAGNLKRVTLELGGKSPFIVFADADLDRAIPAAAMACFLLAGQNCMAGTRLFVEGSIHDRFVEGMVAFTKTLKLGDGADADTMIGPLISARQKERVLGHMRAAREAGAVVACGGGSPDRAGHFVEPTIFTGIDAKMALARQEIFGPVLAVQRFTDEPALIRDVNSTMYGLSGSVWTRDITRALRMAKAVDSGQVGVNAHAAVSPETPFGGNKQSGWGREFGQEGLEPYLKTKAVSIYLGAQS